MSDQTDTATDRVRCPGCGHAACSNPRLECGGESTTELPKPKVGTPAPGREYGRLVPPYSVDRCQAVECLAELDEETGAYLFTDLDSNKLVVFCGATAAYVDLHERDRFVLVML